MYPTSYGNVYKVNFYCFRSQNLKFFTVVLWKVNFKCLVPTRVSESPQEINKTYYGDFISLPLKIKPTKHANILS